MGKAGFGGLTDDQERVIAQNAVTRANLRLDGLMDQPGSHAKALQLLDAAVGDMRALSDAFQVFDADNDGKLTEEEVVAGCGP